jgi:hypothetical protein
MSEESSRLRLQLRETLESQQRQLELLLSERGPIIHGSFGSRARVCGTPNCRCTRGELHESKYLSASTGGRVRQVHVPASDEVDVRAGVERHRRFREARARLAEIAGRQLELVDRLGRSLLKPYPPDNPLPPPAPPGRPPSQESPPSATSTKAKKPSPPRRAPRPA